MNILNEAYFALVDAAEKARNFRISRGEFSRCASDEIRYSGEMPIQLARGGRGRGDEGGRGLRGKLDSLL